MAGRDADRHKTPIRRVPTPPPSRLATGLTISALALGVASPSLAQDVDARGTRARYGTLALPRRVGTPLPRGGNLGGTAGGDLRFFAFQRVGRGRPTGTCRGHFSEIPSHIVRNPSERSLRLTVDAPGDTTMVAMLPDGQILCSDDDGPGVNPMLETLVPPGLVRVWVGAYAEQAVGTTYRLRVQESARADPLAARGWLRPGQAPLYGLVNAARRPLSTPQMLSGTAGGPLAGSDVAGACRGYFSAAPNHVLLAPSGLSHLRVIVRADGGGQDLDTTLLLRLPNGQVVCDDDGGRGYNPMVTTRAIAGRIEVWVGSYRRGQSAPYRIAFTDDLNAGTNSIPPPGGMPGAAQPQVVVAPPPGNVPVTVTPASPTRPAQLQPAMAPQVVTMQKCIPVTLMGPGMNTPTLAVWNLRGGASFRIGMQGQTIEASGVTLGLVPSNLSAAVVTVTVRGPRGREDLLLAAEDAEADRRFLMRISVERGQPNLAASWTGTFRRRPPAWARGRCR